MKGFDQYYHHLYFILYLYYEKDTDNK